MNNLIEIQINPKDIVNGGMTLWVIEMKERFYNGRVRILALITLATFLFFYKPVISFMFLGILLLIILIYFSVTFYEYKQLSMLHKDKQANIYFLRLIDEGFSHSLNKEGKVIAFNDWKSYDYLIDVKHKGLLILVHKNGGVNIFHESWMTQEDFAHFKDLAYRKIGRKLNDRFV